MYCIHISHIENSMVCYFHIIILRHSIIPWVHLRKMEADTPPLEGLPQTKSTTSLFNSDMTIVTAGESTGTPPLIQQQRGDNRGMLRPTCKLFPRLIVHFSWQVEPVALATSYLCFTTQSDSSGWQQTGG